MRTSFAAAPATLPTAATFAARRAGALRAVLYATVIAIFLVRSSLDTVLDIVQIQVGGGSQLTLGAVFNAMLIGITLILVLVNTRRISWVNQAPWLLFVIYCAVMSITTSDPIGVLRMLLVIVSYLCAFLLPFLLIRSRDDTKKFLNVIIWSSFLPAFVALDQFAGGGGNYEDGRVAATFTHPNILAFYTLVVMAAIAFRLVSDLYKDTTVKRGFLMAYGVLLGIVLISTQTRSAWLSATLFLLTYAVFVNRRALLAFLALPLVIALSPSIQERLLDAIAPAEYIGNGVILNSYEWRQQLWGDALTWIYQSPFAGHGGIGSFITYSPEFFRLESVGVYAHNVFIQLAFEVGVIGAALFAAIFLFMAWRFLKAFQFDRAASVIGVTFCVVYLALSYSDNMLYYLAFNWYAFMFLGTLIVIVTRPAAPRVTAHRLARHRGANERFARSRPTTSSLRFRRPYAKLRNRL